MKKRIAVFLNFIAFNLLFFAMYLNFIHKDAVALPAMQQQIHSSFEGPYNNKTLIGADAKQTAHITREEVTVSKKEKAF